MKAKKVARKAVPTPPKIEEEQLPPPSKRPWYIALLAAGILVLCVSIALVLLGTLDGWEEKAFNVINHVNLPGWVASQVAKPLSNAVWGMVGLVVFLLAFPKLRLLAWQYAAAGGSTYAAVFIVEHLVDRARPIGLESYDVVTRAAQDGPGFPSGHVAVLTALGLTLWPMVSWPWRVCILLLVAAEAWARIFLGVHAPLDVVGGLAIGASVIAALHLLPTKIRTFFKLGA